MKEYRLEINGKKFVLAGLTNEVMEAVVCELQAVEAIRREHKIKRGRLSFGQAKADEAALAGIDFFSAPVQNYLVRKDGACFLIREMLGYEKAKDEDVELIFDEQMRENTDAQKLMRQMWEDATPKHLRHLISGAETGETTGGESSSENPS